MSRRSFQILQMSAAAILAAATIACHHPPPATPAPPPPPPPAPVQAPPPPPAPPPARAPQPPPPPPAPSEAELFARKSLADLNAEKPLADVFFELDKSDLSDTDRQALQTDATWLMKWTSTRITIEGHCDSRGSSEYNLALGDRRAAATRDFLVSLGVPTARVNIVSMGKEQPFCTDENEACWSQNRRGHFVITAK